MEKRHTGRVSSIDMTVGAIWPVLLQFTVPLLLGNLFQLLYNTVDSIVVGNFVGRSALAGVSATTQICNTLVKFFNGTSIGAGAVISQCFGAKDQKKLHDSIQTTIALTFIACVLLTTIGLLGADWMLRRMSTPEDVFIEASTYLRIYFAGISGLLIYNIGSSILRAVGDTKRPLFFLLVCSGLNVILDLVFVIVFHWGIAGAAFATILSQFISAVLVLWTLTYAIDSYRFSFRSLRIDRRMTKRILQIGLPVGIQQAIVAFSNVFVQAYVNAFDTACIAGWGCYAKLDQYMMLPIQSMGQATTTFVGQNIGAAKPDRAKKGTRVAFFLIFAISAVVAAVLSAFAPQLTKLFINDSETIAFGTLFIRLCTPFATLCCVNQVLSGALRGIGKSQVPTVITLCTHVLSRQLYLFAASRILPGNVYVIGFGYPVGWILCAVVITVYYKLNPLESAYRSV